MDKDLNDILLQKMKKALYSIVKVLYLAIFGKITYILLFWAS